VHLARTIAATQWAVQLKLHLPFSSNGKFLTRSNFKGEAVWKEVRTECKMKNVKLSIVLN
jgi:hypothetical protein